MRITSLRIQNFRSIKNLSLELGQTTVLVGPNNAGKTAILDALRIGLTRRWGQRGTGFTEYDVHLETEGADPHTAPSVVVEVRAEEKSDNEWPAGLTQELDDIIQTDPATGRNSIGLRVTCAWKEDEAAFQPTWTFLDAARQPLTGRSLRRLNLEAFWQYLPVFYLDALRDAKDEYSPRSQFWGRLLKTIDIPDALQARMQRVLGLLNRKLLGSDPAFGQIATTLSEVTKIAARDREGGADLRLLPLKTWDLLSKAEVVLRNEPEWPWLPLQSHGQGMQSLSVLFLFRAFVDQLLTELYKPESAPVLALEEPEAHLHPQAARALWSRISELPGQKIVTTHSPFFVQGVPFRDLRLVRITDRGTEVFWLPSEFTASVPFIPALTSFVAARSSLLAYEQSNQTLTVKGSLAEGVFRDLLVLYAGHPNLPEIQVSLRSLCERSALYIPDDELQSLETYARRIRGEIFFARRWLIVEGQVEYLLFHAMGRATGYDLDDHGVSVIDSMNNGNPAHFAVLARALNIPWAGVFDGDPAGRGYIRAIEGRGFSAAEVTRRCSVLPAGKIEDQLIADGLMPELKMVLERVGILGAASLSEPQVRAALEANKVEYAAGLADRMSADPALVQRMPLVCRNALSGLRSLQ